MPNISKQSNNIFSLYLDRPRYGQIKTEKKWQELWLKALIHFPRPNEKMNVDQTMKIFIFMLNSTL